MSSVVSTRWHRNNVFGSTQNAKVSGGGQEYECLKRGGEWTELASGKGVCKLEGGRRRRRTNKNRSNKKMGNKSKKVHMKKIKKTRNALKKCHKKAKTLKKQEHKLRKRLSQQQQQQQQQQLN